MELQLFNDSQKQRKLGLKTLEPSQIYARFTHSDLPRFRGHYYEAEQNSDIVLDLQYVDGQFEASHLTLRENTYLKWSEQQP